MKFSSAAQTGGRDAMRERQRRGRLTAQPLRKRYPELGSLQLEFEFSDRGHFVPSPQKTEFHPPAPAYFLFACPYSDCNGEFDLSQPTDTAVSSRTAKSKGELRCTGVRHGGTACTLSLEYSISPQWS